MSNFLASVAFLYLRVGIRSYRTQSSFVDIPFGKRHALSKGFRIREHGETPINQSFSETRVSAPLTARQFQSLGVDSRVEQGAPCRFGTRQQLGVVTLIHRRVSFRHFPKFTEKALLLA